MATSEGTTTAPTTNMTSEIKHIAILGDIPLFRGLPRKGEVNFVEGVNVDVWFGKLDSHFGANRITDDQTKLRIAYAHIDVNSGDAQDTMQIYYGSADSFEEVKEGFLRAYRPRAKGAKPAAKIFHETIVNAETACKDIADIYKATRLVVESYIDGRGATLDGITRESKLNTGVREIPLLNILENFAIHLAAMYKLDSKVYDRLAHTPPSVNGRKFVTCIMDELRDDLFKNPQKYNQAGTNQDILYLHDKTKKPLEDNGSRISRDRHRRYRDDSRNRSSSVQSRRYRNDSRNRSSSVQSRRYRDDSRNRLSPLQSRRHRDDSSNRSQEQKYIKTNNNTCYRCGRPGHFAKECREIPCNYCKATGHTENTCRKKRDGIERCKHCRKSNHRSEDCVFKNHKPCRVCGNKSHEENYCFRKNSVNYYQHRGNKVRFLEEIEDPNKYERVESQSEED